MTIEELYLWAKENGYENHEIYVMQSDGSYAPASFAEIEFGFNSVEL